ncbi:BTAD domain-containing putative transcriptional regulator [Baekduia sp.]|uniref:BTAD domain-containing putative transcriptional regulator n=1 Tax=Baekduia sp. TaxID=2600305 RepID=UPI002E0B535B|nr:BTAD domain-containing putative transcriptional regulator [Baekduia sp.]
MGRQGLSAINGHAIDADLAAELVEHHPAAIVVQDAGGHVVAANRAAVQLLGAAVSLDVGAPVGCAILGCRGPGTRLEGICVHELALGHEGPLPPLRVDLPAGAQLDVASATIQALPPSGRLVVTELRREVGHLARERPGSPSWSSAPQLRLFVLGRTCVTNGDEVLEGRWINNRPGQILKLLVAERHRNVFSDEIISLLWPPSSSPDTRGVRYFVHELREQLEPGGAVRPPSSFVVATRGGYALDHDNVWIDADAFEQLVTEGCAVAGQDDACAMSLIRQGVAMYRGDLLADEPYAEWALHERDRLRDLVAGALRTLAEIETRDDDLSAATATLSRLAELEPFDIDVHRELFSLLLRRGRRSETMRRYETLRRRMLSTFDEPLDFSLSQLI